MKRRLIEISLVIILTTLKSQAASLGIMVPAYCSPASGAGYWNSLNFAAARVPLIAIMNPNSGPGAAQMPGYVNALAKLHAAGGKIIGYVSSSYTKRPLANVQTDIDRYLSWYAVDGFFIDEMTNDSDTNHLNYYATVYEYIKAKGSQYSVTGNPGANTKESYLTRPTADILMNFESGSAKYASYNPSSWVAKHTPEHFVQLPYGVVGTTTMSNYVALAVNRNAGWIYISDLTTYHKLPTYWTNEVNLVKALNATDLLSAKTEAK